MNFNPHQARDPKGIPSGGQFAATTRSEASSGLAGFTERNAASWNDQVLTALFGDSHRHDALLAEGYVTPQHFQAVDDPRSTAKRDLWWAQHFMSGEYREGGTGYARMPDNYTPKRTRGQSLEGERRTHRMAYSADGITVRMPSMTAIRRFSAETGDTIEVPFSAVDAHGRKVEGHMLITDNGGGRWAVSSGFTGTTDAQLSELVSSVLERRRPARLPEHTGAVIEASRQVFLNGGKPQAVDSELVREHRTREAGYGSIPAPVTSTWIAATSYSDATQTMSMQTKTGRLYGYQVPRELYEEVAGSTAPGALFNKYVRNSAVRMEVSQCETCGAVHAATVEHVCKPVHRAPQSEKAYRSNMVQRQAAAELAKRLREARAAARV